MDNRRLYMDEATLSKVSGFLEMEHALSTLTRELAALATEPGG